MRIRGGSLESRSAVPDRFFDADGANPYSYRVNVPMAPHFVPAKQPGVR